MIRFIHCVRRKEGVSVEAFRAFWHSPEFDGLIDQMLGLALTAGVRKNLTLDIELNQALQDERGAGQPFDGVLEILWQSGRELAELTEDAEFQRLTQEMEELQSEFVDFAESRRFFTEYEAD